MEAARHAIPADVDAIIDLCRQARAELRPNRGGDVWSRREARPEPIEDAVIGYVRGDEDGLALVGTIDETIVGYSLARFETLHDDALLLGVQDIFVVDSARGVGVGEAMMDLLVERAMERGAIGIDALVLPGDRESKNFFETFGLKARAILVHRSLVFESFTEEI